MMASTSQRLGLIMFEMQSRSYLRMLHFARRSCLDLHNQIANLTSAINSGMLQSNLDSFKLHENATLWDALRCLYLVEDSKQISPMTEDKKAGIDGDGDQPESRLIISNALQFILDSLIKVEGSNLSISQHSLVSLVLVLVKDSKILILDKATASVNYETDRKIQDTIITKFYDCMIDPLHCPYIPSPPFLQ